MKKSMEEINMHKRSTLFIKRNKGKINLCISLFILIISLVSVYSYQESTISLNEGKNNITFNVSDSDGFYVKELAKLNPDIEVVSYKEENLTHGYVNIFRGIGENFQIKGGVEYEIITRKESHLILPVKP
jgi:hypothetical protein